MGQFGEKSLVNRLRLGKPENVGETSLEIQMVFLVFSGNPRNVAQKSQRFHRKVGKITNIAENRLGKQPEKSPSDVFRNIGNSEILGNGS